MTEPGEDGRSRRQLVRLVEQLPDEDLAAACRYLESLVGREDRLARILMEAPEEEEQLSAEGRRLVEEGLEDLRAGRTHSLDEVKRELGL